MLDETTCPVCGKQFVAPHEAGRTASHEASSRVARWAVAHYLAHLVQQNQRNPWSEAGATYHKDPKTGTVIRDEPR